MQVTGGHDATSRDQATNAETLATFGGRVRTVRKARRIKLITCAKQIGISRTGLQAWESDGVANPDTGKLLAFTKLTEVPLAWLIDGSGPMPDLAAPKPARNGRVKKVVVPIEMPPDHALAARNLASIPEIAPSMTSHASALDLTPRAVWQMPADALEIGFNANAGQVAIKRVVTREGSEFGVVRGDYVLIDYSRTQIDEPGIYLLADPAKKCAKRAKVEWQRDKLRIILLADDVDREDHEIDHGNGEIVVLGRIMGIFHPA